MLERLPVVLGLMSIAVVAWLLLLAWQLFTARRQHTGHPLTRLAPPGRPAVIALSRSTCVECRTYQAPLMARLAAAYDQAITVRSIDIQEHRELLDRIGLPTTPATLVIDASGAIRHLNLGITSHALLRDQVRTCAIMAPAPSQHPAATAPALVELTAGSAARTSEATARTRALP